MDTSEPVRWSVHLDRGRATGNKGSKNLSPMAFHCAHAGAGFQVPQPDRFVSAARRKKPAVGRKRHTSDDMAAKSLEKIALTYLLD